MKAAVINKYGSPDVIQIQEVNKPTPKENELLVQVKDVSATIGDARIRGAYFPKGFGFFARLAFGLFKPRIKILGSSFSGIVVEVGKEVQKFKVGDEVLGMMGMKMGAYAEFLTLNENKSVVKKPKEMSFTDAAAITFGGTTALFFLKDKANISEGQSVLINGASGAVGTSAVQIAKALGAKVTGVCSTSNIELVKSLGANEVIDYTKENILESNQKFDFIMDCVGNISIKNGLKLLNPSGKLILIAAGLPEMLKGITNSKKILIGTASEKAENIEALVQLYLEGKLKPFVEKVFKFEEVVEAHKLIDSKHKKGNIILQI